MLGKFMSVLHVKSPLSAWLSFDLFLSNTGERKALEAQQFEPVRVSLSLIRQQFLGGLR